MRLFQCPEKTDPGFRIHAGGHDPNKNHSEACILFPSLYVSGRKQVTKREKGFCFENIV